MKAFAFALTVSISVAFVVAAGDDDCILTLPDGTDCPAEGQDFYPDRDHCSRYWNCFEGCAHHMMCQGDYLYDEAHQWCNYPEQVDCGDRDCDGRPCKEHEDPVDFKCPQPNGFFEDPNNCMKYFHCYDNIPERLSCQVQEGQQLMWDQTNEWCNWPNSVNCGTRPICDKNDENCVAATTPKPDGCSYLGSCSTEGSLHSEGDCAQCFCECSAGKYVEICCAQGLLYNPNTQACDWPYNMNC